MNNNHLKIIHCADLHLDSKMETHLSAEKAKIRKAEILQTFSNMVEFAKENDVKIIMIAGDMFDQNKIQEKTKQYVLDIIRENKDIDFLYLCGNHDENSFTKNIDEIPSNLKSFNNDWTCYEYGAVAISGAEIDQINYRILYQRLNLDANKFNIVMLHGQESLYETGKDIINLKELNNKNIDYLALGHIHSYKASKLDSRGIYVYSGCLEARGFDEYGDKGFVLLDIDLDSKKFNYQFIKMAKRTFYNVKVDISNLVTIREISNAINEACASINHDDLVKVVLVGTYQAETKKDLTYFVNELNSRFFFARISDETKLLISADDYKNDISLRGEFIRTVLKGSFDEKLKGDIVMMGLQAINGEDIE